MRNETIEKMRAFAIFIVALGHSIIIFDPSWGIYTTNNQNQFFYILKQFINIIQMPMFIMISGFLYSRACKKYSYKEIAKKKGKRILIPFVIITLFWMVPIRILANYSPFVEKGYFKSAILVFLGIDSGHLWYLPTLYALFMIIYPLNKIIEKKGKKSEIILLIIFFFCFVLGNRTTSVLFISNILSYLIYFYIGFLASKVEDKLKFNIPVLIIFIVFSIFNVFVIKQNYINKLLAFITAIIGVYALYGLFAKIHMNKVIKCLDKNSFAIYLLHSPLIYIIYNNFANINPYILVTMNILIGILIPIGIAILLRKLKLNFVIGEKIVK